MVGLVLVAVEVGRRGARAARRRLGRYGEALAGIAVLGALAVALRTLPWDGPSRAGVPWTLTFWLPPAITWLATVRLRLGSVGARRGGCADLPCRGSPPCFTAGR